LHFGALARNDKSRGRLSKSVPIGVEVPAPILRAVGVQAFGKVHMAVTSTGTGPVIDDEHVAHRAPARPSNAHAGRGQLTSERGAGEPWSVLKISGRLKRASASSSYRGRTRCPFVVRQPVGGHSPARPVHDREK